MALYKKGSHKQQLLDKYFKNVDNGKDKETSLNIGVKKIDAISGIFTSSSLDVPDVENAFVKIFRPAEANDLFEETPG